MDATRRGTVAGSLGWLIVWLVFAGIAVAAILYFALVFVPGERATAIEVWRGRLSAMADDRKAAIAAWLDERRGDARVVAAYPTVAVVLAGQDAAPSSLPPSELPLVHLRGLLDSVRTEYGYAGLYLVDAGGQVRASSTGSSPLGAGCRQYNEHALQFGVEQIDFHTHEDGSPMLAVVAVVRAQGRPIGTVFLSMDPGRWLYPMLQSEPMPSTSAESLLGRQVGDHIQYLSPLRLRPGPPLSFRLPVNAAPLAVVAAIRGEEGFKEFPDYRGVRVLGATRHVPGTGWGLVVKVDRSEALAGLRRSIGQGATAIAGLLLAVAGLGFGAQRALAARHRRELGESEARFALLRDHAQDGIWFVSRDGVIRDANESAAAMHGCTREEFIGRNVREFRPPEDLAATPGLMDAVRRDKGAVFETLHTRRDGSVFPIEVSSRVVQLEAEEVFVSIYRDIRERKRAEQALQQQAAELEVRNEQLMRFNRAAVGRELRMVELKQEVNELCGQLGRPSTYPLGFLDEGPQVQVVAPASTGQEPAGETERSRGKEDN